MKRPAFQFYPESWMANAKLRRCSWGARGVWAAVLCLMHDSDEYGVLRWPMAEIAQAVGGCPVKLLREVVEKGVMKGNDAKHDGYTYRPRHAGKEGPPVQLIDSGTGPCWYSSRMVRDEYLRSRFGGSARFKTPDDPPSHPPDRRYGDQEGAPPGAQPSSAPDQRSGHGAMSLDSISIHGVVDGDDNAGVREPNPLGNNLPLKINGNNKPPTGWHKSTEGIDRAGRMLGMQAKRGEDYEQFKARIFEALGSHIA